MELVSYWEPWSKSYSPSQMAAKDSLPKILSTSAITGLSTTNYQLPYTFAIAVPDYVGDQPTVDQAYGAVRIGV